MLGPDPYDPQACEGMTLEQRIRQYRLYQALTPAIGKQPLDKLRKKRNGQQAA